LLSTWSPLGAILLAELMIALLFVGYWAKRFLMRLEGKGRSVLIDGTICRSHEAARKLASEVASFGGWDLHDDVHA
jgi:hypothetical protein